MVRYIKWCFAHEEQAKVVTLMTVQQSSVRSHCDIASKMGMEGRKGK